MILFLIKVIYIQNIQVKFNYWIWWIRLMGKKRIIKNRKNSQPKNSSLFK